MKWQPYPEYKESGIEWLGKVPRSWSILPLKRGLSHNDGGVWGDDSENDGTIVLRSTEIALDGSWRIEEPARRLLNAKEQKHALLQEGDLLVTKSSGSALHLGKTAVVTDNVAAMNCCYSNFMQRLRTNAKADPRYLFWLLNCPVGRDQLIFFGTTTTGLANLNAEVIGTIRTPFPALIEQRAIAAFLDRETERIDALIAKKERQIELLQEKHAALISHAVTKGLDPSVPIKDSGIEWLGEIPAHWEVVRSKALFHEVNERSESGEEELLTVSHITGVTPRAGKNVYMFMAETLEGYKRCQPGDLVINTMWAWMGALGTACHEGVVSPSYNVYRFRSRGSEPRYYDRLFRTGKFVAEINRFSKGVWKSRLRLYPAEFFEIRIPRPPQSEQRAIAELLEQETERTEILIAKVQESIERLQEYRTALISAAVTGKIDVRGEV